MLNLPQRSTPYVAATIVLVLLIIVLETLPSTTRSVRRMGLAGTALALAKLMGVATVTLALWYLRLDDLRIVVLASLAACGLMTAYREFRRRWKGGDRSWSSLLGGWTVVAQFLSLVLLTGSVGGTILTLLLGPVQALNSDTFRGGFLIAWIENFSAILWLLTLYYILFYTARRLLGGTGFSWMDPPNWRTLIPHIKYTRALKGLRLTESRLADTVRMAYVASIVEEDDSGELVQAIERAALIRPLQDTKGSFTFAVIGDPGEGDRSQINPWRREGQQAVYRKAVEVVEQNQAVQVGRTEENEHEAPGFVVISSDVVYPAGELMDYERALYRPNQSRGEDAIPIYAIPGNHDWYNDLKGFFLNFAYPAAHERETPWARAIRGGPWARYGWPWGALRWSEVGELRKKYGLAKLGGTPGVPSSQQRLPFFELAFDSVPLTVLGIDTGCSGSVDPYQNMWLKRRLRRARSRGHLIIAIVSEPVYVNGTFTNKRGLCDLYGLLREHDVDVVMGGDTHAYEHYEVRYTTADGRQHSAHHFVNGGGGAYLSWPMDYAWKLAPQPGPLGKRFVYCNEISGAEDEVLLHNYFPTAEDMRRKFHDRSDARGFRRLQAWFERRALDHGFSNALDHDRPPLQQSFITARMARMVGDGQTTWYLVLTPWFSHQTSGEMVPQRSIRLKAPADLEARD